MFIEGSEVTHDFLKMVGRRQDIKTLYIHK